MIKSINLSEEQLVSYLNDFYNYFETGYDFEKFLKPYLEKLGLDEVTVTQRSRDGGIDLTAIRPGIGDFSEADTLKYYVQAKRLIPDSTVSVEKIRQLKGTIPFGHKGIFITTAKFSNPAIEESNNDPSKPVVLIDGIKLIESCIDMEIGFVFKPIFSTSLMDKLMGNQVVPQAQPSTNITTRTNSTNRIFIVEKNISINDIRTRILSIPSDVLGLIDVESNEISLKLGDNQLSSYHYNPSRKFISGITSFYQQNGLIDEFGGFNSKRAKWFNNNGVIEVEIENEEGL